MPVVVTLPSPESMAEADDVIGSRSAPATEVPV